MGTKCEGGEVVKALGEQAVELGAEGQLSCRGEAVEIKEERGQVLILSLLRPENPSLDPVPLALGREISTPVLRVGLGGKDEHSLHALGDEAIETGLFRGL